MSSPSSEHRAGEAARGSWLYDPKIRGIITQVVVALALVLFVWWIIGNTTDNLRSRGISSGFSFLDRRAGFDISQSMIEYSANSTFGRAMMVGLLNTLLVAAIGVVTATVLGFLIGIGRLSRNWLIARICTVYVEVFRNVPPLLVIFFWYLGVLAVLPGVRDSIELPFDSYINNRGFFMPRPIWGEGAWLIAVALLVGALVVAFNPAYRQALLAIARGEPAESPIWKSNRDYYPDVALPAPAPAPPPPPRYPGTRPVAK